MSLAEYIEAMPKVELHAHLEGSIRPGTLLGLAERNRVDLPANTAEGLRAWYTFTDFSHFIDVYRSIARCICTPDDIELITREFLSGQAAQRIVYTEATYTAFTQWRYGRIPFRDQLAAINRARTWAEKTLGVSMGIVVDIARDLEPEDGLTIADWAIGGMSDGVIALGLAGAEAGFPPEKFAAAFARARSAGLPAVPHAGETAGPESIWGAIDVLQAARIGHGVRCLEDPGLVRELRSRQIPLEVCPTSNICLRVAPDWTRHPLPRLLAEGLYVTLNSDDPPLFDTTLTGEFTRAAESFELGANGVERLFLNAVRASFLPAPARGDLERRFIEEFAATRAQHIEKVFLS